LCAREVPPMRTMPDGLQIKCHLSDANFAAMEPVIQIAAE
jgi:peptide/nickel transport system ATP-binding protein